MEATVGSSIEALDDVELSAFHKSDEKKFKDEVYDAYRKACAYVHVSRHQIEERLERAEAGKSLGFETAEDLRKVGRLMFRLYDMALTLYFHGYGLPFDYNHQRNLRKYGEAGSWSPDEWPPKRL